MELTAWRSTSFVEAVPMDCGSLADETNTALGVLARSGYGRSDKVQFCIPYVYMNKD